MTQTTTGTKSKDKRDLKKKGKKENRKLPSLWMILKVLTFVLNLTGVSFSRSSHSFFLCSPSILVVINEVTGYHGLTPSWLAPRIGSLFSKLFHNCVLL